jgi:hypothetical protein
MLALRHSSFASVFCHDGEYLPGIDVCEEITVPVASVGRATV